MKILALNDNALFIRSCRERLRMPMVISAGVVLCLLVVLGFVGFHFEEAGKTLNAQRDGRWLYNVFLYIAIMQGVLLLLFGTIAAGRMSFKEKIGGTLEFHRCSPTSRLNQVIGLVLGAPILEWCLFLFLFAISLYLALATRINLTAFFTFYGALILCAVFFHSLTILIALSSTQKYRQAGFIPIFFLLWFFLPVSFALQLSSLYHATWFPAYEYLWQEVIHEAGGGFWNDQLLHSFFANPMPFLPLQLIVQLPLIILMWLGIRRKISQPEGQLFSKVESAAMSFLLLFYYTGSAVSAFFINTVKKGHMIWQKEGYLYIFFCLVFLLMIGGALIVTPSYLSYTKGLQRKKKLGLRGNDYNNDTGSTTVWILTMVLIAAFFYFILSFFGGLKTGNNIACFAVILSQMVFFSSSLEAFKLSKYRQKKALFWTVVGIIWIIVPLFGLVTNTGAFHYYLYSFSPFFSLTPAFDRAGVEFPYAFSLALNGLLAAAAIFMAYRERRIIQTANNEQEDSVGR